MDQNLSKTLIQQVPENTSFLNLPGKTHATINIPEPTGLQM